MDPIPRCISNGGLFIMVTVMAAALQTVGYATQGWMIIDLDDPITAGEFKLSAGLWTFNRQRDGVSETHSMMDKDEVPDIFYRTFRAERVDATAGLSLTVLTLVFVTAAFGRQTNRRLVVKVIAIATAFASGVVSLVAVGNAAEEWRYSKRGLKEDEVPLPYSTIVFGVGSCLLCFVAIGLVIDLKVKVDKERTLLTNGGNTETRNDPNKLQLSNINGPNQSTTVNTNSLPVVGSDLQNQGLVYTTGHQHQQQQQQQRQQYIIHVPQTQASPSNRNMPSYNVAIQSPQKKHTSKHFLAI